MYGRRFSLITDHKPLVSIFSPSKGIPQLSAARLQHWALILSAYRYDIVYRSTKLHANADALSRLPVQSQEECSGGVNFDNLFNFGQIESLPVTAVQIATATRTDPLLSLVLSYVKKGWPETVSQDLKPYFHRRQELTVQNDCVMWGIRVVVPAKFHGKVLTELH